MNEVDIENWSCVSNEWFGRMRDPYAHEFVDLTVGNCLHGKVYGHPKIEDGHRAHTSKIVLIERGGRITTETGTVYLLGDKNQNFCKEYLELAASDL